MLTATCLITSGIAIGVLLTETTASAAAAKKPTEPEDSASPAEAAAEDQEPKSKEAESKAAVGEPPPPVAVKPIVNWITLGIQQDLVFHSRTNDVCAMGSRYECFDAQGIPRSYDSGTYIPGGNQISTPGASPGTWRILLGFDRLLMRRSRRESLGPTHPQQLADPLLVQCLEA